MITDTQVLGHPVTEQYLLELLRSLSPYGGDINRQGLVVAMQGSEATISRRFAAEEFAICELVAIADHFYINRVELLLELGLFTYGEAVFGLGRAAARHGSDVPR